MVKAISFAVLVTLIIAVGIVFLMVMQQFLLPLFLAVLLVIMFRPLHEWFLAKVNYRPHVAAGLTTASIVFLVLVPLNTITIVGGLQLTSLMRSQDPKVLVEDFQQKASALTDRARKLAVRFDIDIPPDKQIAADVAHSIKESIAPLAVQTTQWIGSLLFGLVIMIISVYFFFADGPDMLDAIVRLTPMENQHVTKLLEEFDKISRAVVLATVLAALGQGLLAGIGYLLTGIPNLMLLTAITILMALVPFIGSTVVWVPCVLWLYFMEARTGAALFLMGWCIIVVGNADNFIKPYVLQGKSSLHPLLAFLSVIGGVQTLGPIGIFVGPMVVAFFHTLLVLLRQGLITMEQTGPNNPQNGKNSPGVAVVVGPN
jgi:predicted PurR-regulated permease PerM